MARKPAASAYILALTLRRVVRQNEEQARIIKESNQNIREFNAILREQGVNFQHEETPEDDTLYWSCVTRQLEGMKDVQDALSVVKDADYKAVIYDAIKQPYNKVRKSKGFQSLVPVLETIRRYGAYNPELPMELSEEEARDLADLIWEQEMEPFIENGRGVDPINKQIIANKVATELRQSNVKYLGEEIVNVEFNDVELDVYECDHKDALEILATGIQSAFELFNYDPHNSHRENTRWVRQAVVMYDSMFKKERTDEKTDELVDSLLMCFQYLYHLIE